MMGRSSPLPRVLVLHFCLVCAWVLFDIRNINELRSTKPRRRRGRHFITRLRGNGLSWDARLSTEEQRQWACDNQRDWSLSSATDGPDAFSEIPDDLIEGRLRFGGAGIENRTELRSKRGVVFIVCSEDKKGSRRQDRFQWMNQSCASILNALAREVKFIDPEDFEWDGVSGEAFLTKNSTGVTRFSGTSDHETTPSAFEPVIKSNTSTTLSALHEANGQTTTKSQISTFISHFKIWEIIAAIPPATNGQEELYLIFDDDICPFSFVPTLSRDIKALFQDRYHLIWSRLGSQIHELTQENVPWDIIYLSHLQEVDSRSASGEAGRLRCSHAYLLSARGARKLVSAEFGLPRRAQPLETLFSTLKKTQSHGNSFKFLESQETLFTSLSECLQSSLTREDQKKILLKPQAVNASCFHQENPPQIGVGDEVLEFVGHVSVQATRRFWKTLGTIAKASSSLEDQMEVHGIIQSLFLDESRSKAILAWAHDSYQNTPKENSLFPIRLQGINCTEQFWKEKFLFDLYEQHIPALPAWGGLSSTTQALQETEALKVNLIAGLWKYAVLLGQIRGNADSSDDHLLRERFRRHRYLQNVSLCCKSTFSLRQEIQRWTERFHIRDGVRIDTFDLGNVDWSIEATLKRIGTIYKGENGCLQVTAGELGSSKLTIDLIDFRDYIQQLNENVNHASLNDPLHIEEEPLIASVYPLDEIGLKRALGGLPSSLADNPVGRLIALRAKKMKHPLFEAKQIPSFSKVNQDSLRWIAVEPILGGVRPRVESDTLVLRSLLLSGIRLWYLFPSSNGRSCPPPGVLTVNSTIMSMKMGTSMIPRSKRGSHVWLTPSAYRWFTNVITKFNATERTEKELLELTKGHWILQQSGEIISVPPGWWHASISLKDCVSLRQLCTPDDM